MTIKIEWTENSPHINLTLPRGNAITVRAKSLLTPKECKVVQDLIEFAITTQADEQHSSDDNA